MSTRFTPEQYADLIRRRPHLAPSGGQAPCAQPEPPVCHEPLGPEAGKGPDTGRTVVRIVTYRTRLCDPDDLCPKYFIDGLRYAGLLPGDSEAEIDYERPRQVKVAKRAEERTEIEVTKLPC